jgi:hypothetical protein
MKDNPHANREQLGDFGEIDRFLKKLHIGRLLSRSNISKRKGSSPLTIFSILFRLAFTGQNLFQGIINNRQVTIGKDAFYEFLNCATFNWRKLCTLVNSRIYVFTSHLLDGESEEVLIVDDSIYDRNRSKMVELLAKVFDHNTRRYLKGFRMLTLGWSDGNTFLGLDFALLSSTKGKNRYQNITKDLDKRTCGYIRRREAITKSTELLEPMVARAISMGIRARYILMDSWFSFPSVISSLRKHLDVITMLKDQPTILYEYEGKKLRLGELYRRLKKRRGRAKVKASVKVKTGDGDVARIIFVSCNKKRGWLALLSTDLTVKEEEIIRLYGKRWDIEVFFKVAKQHLKLAKEVQLRDFDGLIAHTSIVMLRYNFLAYQQRLQVDPRTLGVLFRSCCAELSNLCFIDALRRIIALATSAVRKQHLALSEKVLDAILDTVIGVAIRFFGLESDLCNENSAC